MNPLERELELATRAVLATEDWAPTYAKAPDQHAELINLTAKMNRQLMVYLRDLAKEAPGFINWYEYHSAVLEQQRAMQSWALTADSVQAYNVNVVINNDQVNQSDQQLIKVVFDTVASVMATGVESMVTEFNSPIGLTTTSAIIQSLTTDQLAALVGMKVSKDGTIVPNPNPAFNIDETTRNRIAQSIKTSISLGENQEQAVKRLMQVIADANRADMIARTETVRAYAIGRAEYAKQAGMGWKHNYDRNATDFCADNTSQGWIPSGDLFMSGDDHEPFHPRCLCQVVYSFDNPDEAS